MKKFEVKDLLDPEKLKELDKECKELKVKRTREGEVIHTEKIRKQDNMSRLNQMGQRREATEWGNEMNDEYNL